MPSLNNIHKDSFVLSTSQLAHQWVLEGPLIIARQFTGGMGALNGSECRRHD